MRKHATTAVIAAALGAAAGSQISSDPPELEALPRSICPVIPTEERFEVAVRKFTEADVGKCVLLRGQMYKVIALAQEGAIMVPTTLR